MKLILFLKKGDKTNILISGAKPVAKTARTYPDQDKYKDIVKNDIKYTTS